MSSRRRDLRRYSAENQALQDQLHTQRDELRQQEEELQSLRQHAQQPPQHATPVYIRERNVRSFSNSPEDPPIREWLESVERCTRGRSPQDIADFIIEHLKGEAYAEVKHRPNTERRNPKDICTILTQAFGEENQSRVQRERRFFNRRQGQKEGLRKFSHALMALVEKIPNIDDERDNLLKEQFAENVRDAELRRELKRLCRAETDLTFYELREEAIAWMAEEDDSDEEEFSVKQHEIQQQPSAASMDKVIYLLTDLTSIVKGGQQLPDSAVQVDSMNTAAVPQYTVPSATYQHSPAMTMVDPQAPQFWNPSTVHPVPSAMPQPAYRTAQPATFYNNKPYPSSFGDSPPTCYSCGKIGHISRNCRSTSAGGSVGRYAAPANRGQPPVSAFYNNSYNYGPQPRQGPSNYSTPQPAPYAAPGNYNYGPTQNSTPYSSAAYGPASQAQRPASTMQPTWASQQGGSASSTYPANGNSMAAPRAPALQGNARPRSQ